MEVRVKNLVINSDGMQFGVREDPIKKGNLADPIKPGRFRGNIYVTKQGVTWCKGKRAKQNGRPIKWNDLIKLLEEKTHA